MTVHRPDVAILGGGMGAMAAAWRLSEEGWRDDLGSITVYQRGWRLGGKGASSRGRHGRIEEHGLHIWLGYYENSFRLLRECYRELDRERTDPACPIRTWRQALLPQTTVGLEDRASGSWMHWLGRFRANDELPGEPDSTGREMTAVEFVMRAVDLLVDFMASLDDVDVGGTGGLLLSTDAEPPPAWAWASPGSPPGGSARPTKIETAAVAVALELVRLARSSLAERREVVADPEALDVAVDRLEAALLARAGSDPAIRRAWCLASVMVAVVRGIVTENLLIDPDGFSRINDRDFVDWIVSHGASPEVRDFAFMRGLYDLVFGFAGADLSQPGFGAGLGVFLTGKMMFEYKGAIFWKMAAGMGDIVFAPMYQALRARGVRFEFFHRVDALHLSPDRHTIDAIAMGRQVALAVDRDTYEPLIDVKGLACFPDAPLVDQLTSVASAVTGHPLEAHHCTWPDAEERVLRRGEDFDTVIFAIPPAMAEHTCAELIAHDVAWKAMIANVSTVPTQALQLWLRPDEPSLGWPHPGSTVSGFVTPFDTWASMPQLIDVEDWPADDRPGTIAYFCSVLADQPGASVADHHATVRENARRFVEHDLAHLLPGTAGGDGRFRWDLLCGREGRRGPDAIDSQHWVANVDPSDRYVQSLPGTDRYRLRPDESGYDNLFLAGDWTDCGLNAGCIEAAVLSGLQAANAVLGRSRHHRIAGYWLP